MWFPFEGLVKGITRCPAIKRSLMVDHAIVEYDNNGMNITVRNNER